LTDHFDKAMASLASVTKLTEYNYSKWAPEVQDLLGIQGVWRIVGACDRWLPRPPLTPATQPGEKPSLPEPSEWFDLEPQSGDPEYLTQFDRFVVKRAKQKDLLIKASSIIRSTLEPAIRQQYDDDVKYVYNPHLLWSDIEQQYKNQVHRGDTHLLTSLDNCRLSDYPSVTEWISAQDKIINGLAICGIQIQGKYRYHFITKNLPVDPEWRPFLDALKLSEGASGDASSSVAILRSHLLGFEARLRRKKGIAPGAALFVTRKNRRQLATKGRSTDSSESDESEKQIFCFGCGKKGHKKQNCRHPEHWDDKHDPRKKKQHASNANANLTEHAPMVYSTPTPSDDSETYVF
jgi:hypothetical protein